MTTPLSSTREKTEMTVDELAQAIRTTPNWRSLGAGALAEALMPFIRRALPNSPGGVGDWRDKLLDLYRDAVMIDAMMEGPRFKGSNASALKRAWEYDRALVTAPTAEGKETALILKDLKGDQSP